MNDKIHTPIQSSETQLSERNKSSSIPWWYVIIGIDLFLLLATVGNVYLPLSQGVKRIIVWPFNLAVENNFAVWWSGISLSVIGFLAFELFNMRSDRTKKAWLALAILFLGLSADEVGSLHERVGGWSDLLPYGLFCCALFVYALYVLLGARETRKTGILIMVAFFLYGSVAIQEYLEHLINWPEWAMGLRVGVEEGTELLATFLIFCGIVPQRNLQTNAVRAMIPSPHRINYLPKLVFLGLCFHIASVFLFPGLMDYSHQGNPLILYSMNLFLILSCIAFWMSSDSKENRRYWSFLALIFLFCSADIVRPLLSFLPVLRDIVPGKSVSYLLYIILLLSIGFWFLKQDRSIRKVMFSIILVLLALFGSVLYHVMMKGIPLGIWSVVTACCAYSFFYAVEKTRNYS